MRLWAGSGRGYTVMKHVNQMLFYKLGNVSRLRDMMYGDRAKTRDTVAMAEVYLRQLMENSLFKETAPAACRRAQHLLDTVKQNVDAHGDFNEDNLPDILLA